MVFTVLLSTSLPLISGSSHFLFSNESLSASQLTIFFVFFFKLKVVNFAHSIANYLSSNRDDIPEIFFSNHKVFTCKLKVFTSLINELTIV